MFRRLLTGALALCVLSGAGCSKPAPAPAATGTDIPQITFEKYTLPNGLEVILSHDDRLPVVAVESLVPRRRLPVKYPGRTGLAHLFEHMMFQGSKNVPGDDVHISLLEGRIGATAS